jgi:hypothetical protein
MNVLYHTLKVKNTNYNKNTLGVSEEALEIKYILDMIFNLCQYSVSYLIRNSLDVKNDDLQAQCDSHTNNSCKIRRSQGYYT